MVKAVKEGGTQILLNTIVKEVDLESKTVYTSDEVHETDFIVCTVSTGVLREEKISFQPSLPDWKRTAIEQVDMAVYMKIFCAFDQPFWDDSKVEPAPEYIKIAND